MTTGTDLAGRAYGQTTRKCQTLTLTHQKLQRGCIALLLPPDSEISAQKLRSWQHKRITAATWQLIRPDWNEPVFLAGVYKSPGQGLTPGDIAKDIQTLAEIMTSVSPTSIHVVTSDFNAHTSDELDGTRHSLLPPRQGDNLPVNNMGQAFLGLLCSLNWTIMTNLFCHSYTLFTLSVACNDDVQMEQNACIEYFLLHYSHSTSVHGEAILKDSGSEIG
jgi:hypothetical protein